MEKCGVAENIAIGEICRRIQGTTEESCYILREVDSERPETVNMLKPFVSSLTSCHFQKEVIDRIKAKAQSKNK